jgi:hypothetical protein
MRTRTQHNGRHLAGSALDGAGQITTGGEAPISVYSYHKMFFHNVVRCVSPMRDFARCNVEPTHLGREQSGEEVDLLVGYGADIRSSGVLYRVRSAGPGTALRRMDGAPRFLRRICCASKDPILPVTACGSYPGLVPRRNDLRRMLQRDRRGRRLSLPYTFNAAATRA